jgi:hypothetical protein
MKKPYGIALLASSFAIVVVFSGCSTTGGAIGNLIPAPKFLKGSIKDNVYSAPDKYFSVAIPHQQDSDEYRYMQVHEQYLDYGIYVSFGPAALDQSVYRIEIGKRVPPGSEKIRIQAMAQSMIDHYKEMLPNGYGGELRLKEKADRVINGRMAIYLHFEQTVAPGRLMSNRAVEIDHEVYLMDFGKASAMVSVQSPELPVSAG